MSNPSHLKNGMVMVSIETPGGIYNEGQLKTILGLADGDLAVVKATEDQRLALFIKPEDQDRIKATLAAVGLGIRLYQNGLHQPVSCIGELCAEHELDALGTATDLTQELMDVVLSTSLKIGINGCSRCCIPCHTYDISLVADGSGYIMNLGGKNSQIPEMASFIAEGIPFDKVVSLTKSVVLKYQELVIAEDDESLQDVIERCGAGAFIELLAPYSQDAADDDDPFAVDDPSSGDSSPESEPQDLDDDSSDLSELEGEDLDQDQIEDLDEDIDVQESEDQGDECDELDDVDDLEFDDNLESNEDNDNLESIEDDDIELDDDDDQIESLEVDDELMEEESDTSMTDNSQNVCQLEQETEVLVDDDQDLEDLDDDIAISEDNDLTELDSEIPIESLEEDDELADIAIDDSLDDPDDNHESGSSSHQSHTADAEEPLSDDPDFSDDEVSEPIDEDAFEEELSEEIQQDAAYRAQEDPDEDSTDREAVFEKLDHAAELDHDQVHRAEFDDGLGDSDLDDIDDDIAAIEDGQDEMTDANEPFTEDSLHVASNLHQGTPAPSEPVPAPPRAQAYAGFSISRQGQVCIHLEGGAVVRVDVNQLDHPKTVKFAGTEILLSPEGDGVVVSVNGIEFYAPKEAIKKAS